MPNFNEGTGRRENPFEACRTPDEELLKDIARGSARESGRDELTQEQKDILEKIVREGRRDKIIVIRSNERIQTGTILSLMPGGRILVSALEDNGEKIEKNLRVSKFLGWQKAE